MNQKLKSTLDFAPIIAFLAGYHAFDMRVATIALMVTTFISLALVYYFERKLAIAPLVTGVLVGVFGTLTLVLKDDYFIKIKPTIVNLCLAGILLGGAIYKKPLLKYVLEVAFKLHHKAWLTLSMRCGLFFVFLAIVNEIVWRNFSTDFWVNFKLFGMLTMNMAFWIAHVGFIQRNQVEAH